MYLTIAGVAALRCFAFLMTNSFWLTLVVLLLGFLHIARYFPVAEQLVAGDAALRWRRRRLSLPLIIAIFVFVIIYNQQVR